MSKKLLYRIWSEWDIGHDGVVFSTKAKAKAWLSANEGLNEMYELEGWKTLDDAIESGLVTIRNDVELV